jgi:hypothetical protein
MARRCPKPAPYVSLWTCWHRVGLWTGCGPVPGVLNEDPAWSSSVYLRFNLGQNRFRKLALHVGPQPRLPDAVDRYGRVTRHFSIAVCTSGRHPCKSLSREKTVLLTRATEERAKTNVFRTRSSHVCLSAVVPAFAEPDIHLLSRAQGAFTED